ncbi:VOC family protein [Occultella aeris]|uniref:Glyoxalase-like domain protein n=1 Tax=Occultella aeris TaxID=2761496 RepID=A0A7M4DT15_9MICO|nr:VOC family protein [Occultella aeris]VZO40609.1 Glyoxalase-like domain protein [Occultella aeris]
MRLHHVQISMPVGQEDLARRFYADALGLTEVAKPAALAGRGGCWFRAFTDGLVTAELHLGVDDPFAPAKKAHPALMVENPAELRALGERVAEAGFEVSWAERTTFSGYERFHCRDGFDNRIEVMTTLGKPERGDRPGPAN